MNRGYRRVDPQALLRVLEDSGATFRTNNKSYVFTCPRCTKKDKLMMYRSDGRFICWVCAETSGFKGRPEFALTEITGLSIEYIREKIYGDSAEEAPLDYLNISLADFYGDEEPPLELEQKTKGLAWPLDFYPIDHPHAVRGLEYLQGRGVGLELARAYELRYSPVQKRVIFPVLVGGKLMGWQARAIFPTEWEVTDEETGEVTTKKAPKILTTGKRDAVLMFQDRLAGSDHAIICEGPVDGIKCHLAGGNVVTMGKVVSEQQVNLIRNSGVRRVYLAQDPDAATETMKLLYKFSELEVYRLLPAPGFEDLGAMTPEQVLQQFLVAERVRPGSLFLYFGSHA